MTTLLRRRQGLTKDERGASLLIALGFITVFGIIMAAIFSNAGANLRNTVTVRVNQQRIYAADSAIDWGIQRLRNDDTICPVTSGSPVTMSSVPTFNGATPTVTCTTTAGSSASQLGGWALVTHSASVPSLTTPGPNFQKTINGPVWSSGIDNSIDDLNVTNGDVYENAGGSTCTSDADKPTKLVVSPNPPYSYRCTSTLADPTTTIDHAPPLVALATATAQSPNGTTVGSCRIFTPGRYTSINLADDNYFATGVYYFQNIGALDVRKRQVVGGKAHADEASTTLLTACGTDANVPVGTTLPAGTGVKFILGGNSYIPVSNPSGRMELFSRQGGVVADEGTQGISVQTVTSDVFPGAWAVSTLTDSAGNAVLSEESGNTPALVIHGGVYTPNAWVDFDATNGARAWLLGGAVVGKIAIRQQATIDGSLVSITTGIGERVIKLRSVVDTGIGSDRRLVATAIIKIKNDANRTLTIQSWRTSCELPGGGACPNL